MSIINTNGQPITAEAPVATAQVQPQRQSLTPAEMQRIIGGYARLKELNAATITSPKEDAEKTGLQNFLAGALLANAEELFGCWVAVQQEYTPLITGFSALLRRCLNRIDAAAKAQEVVPPAAN
jgi:hypothetical protein